MQYTPVNHFQWQANNFTDLYPGNAAATTLTAHATPHTKGADTACMVGIAEDCYGIAITVSVGDTAATIRRQMIDLLIDPAAGVGNAGSAWSVAINNIYTNCPSMGTAIMGHNFYFPLFLKAGTAFGARVQDVVTVETCRFSIRVLGKPTHPELVKVGTSVQTLGADTATTSGVTVVPGTAAYGSYSATLGTLTKPAWWWQLGIGSNDSTVGENHYRFDIAHDATAKYICARGIIYQSVSSNERSGKAAMGEGLPINCAPAGQDVYVRGAALATSDSSMTAVVYAVGE